MSDARTPGERWLPVLGWEELYEVSDQGRVRSLDRLIAQSNGVTIRKAGRVLKASAPGYRGGRPEYSTVVLCPLAGDTERRRITRSVHTLVLDAFAGARPEGLVARHLNGDHCVNTAANLAWGTYSANAYDQVRHGTHKRAARRACPQGHGLREPNLVRYRQAGHRGCLACARARAARQQAAAKSGAPFDFKAVADKYYAAIMMTETADL